MSTRDMIESHLALAEKHISIGERNLASQRQIVLDLERNGRDTTQARALLVQFEELQTIHIEDRDRLRRELAALP